jgi:glycosyltransferase involved in cell wall biosynthesis
MDKVRVLFLPGVDADNTNAQSLNVREIARRLDPERFECSLWYEREPDPRLQGASGVRLLKLPVRGKTRRILRELLAGYDLVSYVDFSPASYIFLHLPRALRGKTKAVFHAEAPAAQLGTPSWQLQTLYNGIYPRCDAYTGITEFVARDVERSIGKRASHILPVGVDTKFFTPPAGRRNRDPVVLFAGTLIERKGPQHLVDAAVHFPQAQFRIVGASRGGFEDVLRRKIESCGLKNVRLEGPKTQSEMMAIMRASDIFVLPSRLEGIPKVTLEAAATGMPCIVFRDYETPSVVDGLTGFQVESTATMIERLGQLIEDPGLRESMGTAARKHVERFDWDTVGRLWQNAYLEMAGRLWQNAYLEMAGRRE